MKRFLVVIGVRVDQTQVDQSNDGKKKKEDRKKSFLFKFCKTWLLKKCDEEQPKGEGFVTQEESSEINSYKPIDSEKAGGSSTRGGPLKYSSETANLSRQSTRADRERVQ